MTTRPFDAVIFDHDGTLVDTEISDYRAWATVFEEHGGSISLEMWGATVVGHHHGYPKMFAELARQHGQPINEASVQRRLQELWPITLESVAVLPGVEALLDQLIAARYPLAVATASDQAWASQWLTKFNLIGYFHDVVTSDDVVNNKPAPDVYLEAAERLGVAPERCLVFEDSLAGTQSAKAAGMTVVAVPGIVTRSLDFSIADRVIDSMTDIDVNWIETFK